jgi:hypothetical protein
MPPRNLAGVKSAVLAYGWRNGVSLVPAGVHPTSALRGLFAQRCTRTHASCVAWVAFSTPGLRCTSCTLHGGGRQVTSEAASIIRVTHRSGDSRLSAPSRTARLSVRRYLRSAPWPLAALSAPLSSAGRADPFPAIAARAFRCHLRFVRRAVKKSHTIHIRVSAIRHSLYGTDEWWRKMRGLPSAQRL